jgi:hypothetical protein
VNARHAAALAFFGWSSRAEILGWVLSLIGLTIWQRSLKGQSRLATTLGLVLGFGGLLIVALVEIHDLAVFPKLPK